MDLTLAEILNLIAALETEFANARAAGDQTRIAELEAAFQALLPLRAQALVREADILAGRIDQQTAAVDRAIVRLTDPRAILTLRNLSNRTGIGIPVVPGTVTPPPDIPTEPPVPGLGTSEPAPAGGPSTYVAARRTAQMTVLYTDDQGREFVRIGGSRAWRNCNPGNIRKGSFALANGSIGDDGSFAVFPNRPTGSKAIESLFRGPSYRALSIEKAINRYAPPQENDTNAYLEFVIDQSGLSRSDVIADLPVADVRKIVRAVEAMEGWKEGEERAHRPSSGIGSSATGGTSAAVGAAAEWMDVARREEAAGVAEVAGSASNPRILEYFRVAASWFNPAEGDETEWCAAFVNYCLETSGHVGTGHPGARSFFWNKNRQFVSLSAPRKFAIAVRRNAPFGDPAWETGTGHVGFIVGFNSTHVTLLGGNQSNRVREQEFPLVAQNAAGNVASKFVAFMMPVMD